MATLHNEPERTYFQEAWRSVYVVLSGIFFLLAFAFGIVYLFPNPEPENASQYGFSKDNEEWCLIQTLPHTGGSFSYPEAGQYEYLVLQNHVAIFIYQKCAKLE